MVVIWGLGFGRIRAAEIAAMAAINVLFVVMNQAASKQGKRNVSAIITGG